MSASALTMRERHQAPLPTYRFTVEQYHRMITGGTFSKDDHCELLEGWAVLTYTLSPPHASAISLARDTLAKLLPHHWLVRVRSNITTKDSEPRPDLAVVRGPIGRYREAHPGPRDIGFVVEVTDVSYAANREFKRRVYARARIPVYWTINLVESQVELYSEPRGGKSPAYLQRQVYRRRESVPLIVSGNELGKIPVRDLLP